MLILTMGSTPSNSNMDDKINNKQLFPISIVGVIVSAITIMITTEMMRTDNDKDDFGSDSNNDDMMMIFFSGDGDEINNRILSRSIELQACLGVVTSLFGHLSLAKAV